MTKPRIVVGAWLTACLVAVMTLVSAACSSGSNGSGAGSDGADANEGAGASGGEGARDAGASPVPEAGLERMGDALPGAATSCIAASEDASCRTYVCPGAGCNPPLSCQKKRLAACGTLAATFSAAYNEARAACESVDCKDLAAQNACLFPKLEASPRTAAQSSIARSYCEACAPARATACETNFYAAGSSYGDTLLLFSDQVLARLEASCLGGDAADACSAFGGCLLSHSGSLDSCSN